MVTIQDAVQYVNGVACTAQKVWCKSTDVKPTEGIGNGCQLREMDTGKDYAFDAESGEWLEQPSEGGGGGGGGGGGFTLLQGTYDGNTNTIALNKTCEELFVLTQASVVGIQFEPVDGMTVIEFVAQATNEYNFAMLSGLVAYGSGSDVVVFQARQ